MIVDPIICDDIREEASGKVTLIGTYSEAMLINKFPTMRPTFCVYWRLRGVHPLPKKIELLVESELIGEPIRTELDMRVSSNEEHGNEFLITFPQMLAAVAIEKPGEIILRALSDGDEVFHSLFPIILNSNS